MKKFYALLWFMVFLVVAIIESLIAPILRTVAVFCAFIGKGKVKQWGINVWEGVDNAVSAELGGDPDESISSRLGKARLNGSRVLSFIADRVDLVAEELAGDVNHCNKSVEKDEGIKQVTTY